MNIVRELWKTFVCKWEELSGSWKQLPNEGLYVSCSLWMVGLKGCMSLVPYGWSDWRAVCLLFLMDGRIEWLYVSCSLWMVGLKGMRWAEH